MRFYAMISVIVKAVRCAAGWWYYFWYLHKRKAISKRFLI